MPALTDAVIPAGTWSIDPVHSAVAFEVRDMEALIATVSGRFVEFEGTLVGGPSPSAEGVIQVASINTGEPERDQDLRSADYFDVERHRQILFRSQEISAVDDGMFAARGILEIQGRQHPVAMRGEVLGTGRDRDGAERVALEAEGKLEWAGKQIRIRVQVSAQQV